MLRSVRSFGSLRVLGESTAAKSTKYSLHQANIKHNPFNINFSKSVHQSSKQNQSTLLSSKTNEFSMMSVQSLKNECRKRGLKVSGRKNELVSRISDFDSASVKDSNKNFSTTRLKKFKSTPALKKKGDASTIDYIKPVDMSEKKLVEDDYIVKIPSLTTEASKTPVTKLEKKLQSASSDLNETVVSQAPGSEAKVFTQTQVDVNETSQFEPLFEDSETTSKHAQQDAKEPESLFNDEPYEYEKGDIPAGDKPFLYGFAAAVGAWFLLKPKEKKHS